jgi:hypothetical protein
MGENSDVTLGSMLVPDAMNPTEFSIAAIPGMLPCAPTKGANSSIQGKISSFFIPDFSEFRRLGFSRRAAREAGAYGCANTALTISEVPSTKFGEPIK